MHDFDLKVRNQGNAKTISCFACHLVLSRQLLRSSLQVRLQYYQSFVLESGVLTWFVSEQAIGNFSFLVSYCLFIELEVRPECYYLAYWHLVYLGGKIAGAGGEQ